MNKWPIWEWGLVALCYLGMTSMAVMILIALYVLLFEGWGAYLEFVRDIDF